MARYKTRKSMYQHTPFTHLAVKGDANTVIPKLHVEVILIADHSLILQTGLTVQGK